MLSHLKKILLPLCGLLLPTLAFSAATAVPAETLCDGGCKSRQEFPRFSAGTPGAATTYPSNQQLYDRYPWAATYYYGVTTSDALVRIFKGEVHRWPEHMQSLEIARTLSPNNFLRHLVRPLVGVVQVAANFSIRDGSKQKTSYEFDPYLQFRWANFPWNHYVNTSLAIGEGISYASVVPAIERRYSNNTKRLLNYLMLEATFAPPNYPRLQLIARVHHRSGAYGLYRAGNSGSNDIGLGVRFLFD